jgi:hypothetical protein
MIEAVAAAIDKEELLPMEAGAICYMLSKQGYLNMNRLAAVRLPNSGSRARVC